MDSVKHVKCWRNRLLHYSHQISSNQLIGSRKILQETSIFTTTYGGFHADLPLIQSRDQMHTLDDRHTGISEAPIPALPFLMQLLTNMHIEKLCKLKSAIIKASCLGVMIFIWPLPGPHTSIPEVWPGTPFLGDDLISGILHDLSTRQKYVPENSKQIKVDPVLNYKLNSHVY